MSCGLTVSKRMNFLCFYSLEKISPSSLKFRMYERLYNLARIALQRWRSYFGRMRVLLQLLKHSNFPSDSVKDSCTSLLYPLTSVNIKIHAFESPNAFQLTLLIFFMLLAVVVSHVSLGYTTLVPSTIL